MTAKDISSVFNYIDDTCALADEHGYCMTDKCKFCDKCMGGLSPLELLDGESFWEKFIAMREKLDVLQEAKEEKDWEKLTSGYYSQDELDEMNWADYQRDCDADARWEMEQGVF